MLKLILFLSCYNLVAFGAAHTRSTSSETPSTEKQPFQTRSQNMYVLFPIRLVPCYTTSTPIRPTYGVLLDWYATTSYRSNRSSTKYSCCFRHCTILMLNHLLKSAPSLAL